MAFMNSLEADVVTRMCEHARDVILKDVYVTIIFKRALLI